MMNLGLAIIAENLEQWRLPVDTAMIPEELGAGM